MVFCLAETLIAAPLFRVQSTIGKLLLDTLGLGVGLIDFVHSHNDGNVSRARVIDGFESLRHDAVVGRHYQDHDVSDLGAPRAHARECFVTGGVDEHNLAPALLHVIGADVLGDSAGFFFRYVGDANGIEQRSLAMVDVTHDGDHGSALHAVRLDLGLLNVLHRFLFEGDGVYRRAEIPRQLVGQLGIERLVDGGEDIAIDQLLDHQAGFHVQLLGKLFYGDAFRDGDLAIDRRWARWGFAPHRP